MFHWALHIDALFLRMLHPPAPLHKGDGIGLFLTILIQPSEELTIPVYRVLWLQDPVVFFWEEEELGINTHHASSIECSHTLVYWYAVVHFTVSYEDRSVPVLDELVCRVAIVTVSLWCAVPWSATVVEVREQDSSVTMYMCSWLKIPA